jgi:hypothetical protein
MTYVSVFIVVIALSFLQGLLWSRIMGLWAIIPAVVVGFALGSLIKPIAVALGG